MVGQKSAYMVYVRPPIDAKKKHAIFLDDDKQAVLLNISFECIPLFGDGRIHGGQIVVMRCLDLLLQNAQDEDVKQAQMWQTQTDWRSLICPVLEEYVIFAWALIGVTRCLGLLQQNVPDGIVKQAQIWRIQTDDGQSSAQCTKNMLFLHGH
jgi:hypothetical protein